MDKPAGAWVITHLHIMWRLRINIYKYILYTLVSFTGNGITIIYVFFYFPTWSMATANDFQFDLLALTKFDHECKL